MDFGDLMRRGWNLTWNNKWMFVLGFVAALAGGSNFGGNFNVPSGNMSQPFDPAMTNEMETILAELANFWATYGWLVILGVLALVVLSIVLWLLSLIGRAGLIHAAAALDAKQPTSLRQAWSAGVGKLGRMVGLSLLLALPFLIIGLVIAVGAVLYLVPVFRVATTGSEPSPGMMTSFVAGPVIFACLACILGILGLIVTFIQPFAMRGLVLRNLGVVDSIRHGWQVLRNNVGNILILALIFLVVGIIVGLVAIFVAGLLAAPFVAPILLGLVRETGLTALNITLAVLGGLVFLVALAAVNSVLVAFQSTTFTLAYQQFVSGKQPEALPV